MVGRTDHSFFSERAHFVLTKDAFRTFYLYSENKEKLSQGTYACTSIADGKRLLTLTQTTPEGEKVYRFALLGKELGCFALMERYLGIAWVATNETRTNIQITSMTLLDEENPGNSVELVYLPAAPIPDDLMW